MNAPVLEPARKRGLTRRLWWLTLLLGVTVLAGVSRLGGFGRADFGASGEPRARRILFYQDSMHPWVKSEQAGKCTICSMDLTPIYEGEKGQHLAENVVALSPDAITALHVQTDEVKRQPLLRTLQVAGTLEANEAKKRIIAAPAAGRIDELAVDYAGVEVREGQPLLTFYSPALTQDKLRFLVRTRHMGQQRDPSGNLAKDVDASPYFTDLLAPQDGTVLERKVTKGQYVAEGEKLFTLADAAVLWFRFDVYEQQLPWLRRGQKIQISVPALPGKSFTGVISFLEPMLNEATRTVKVRADIPNPVVEADGQKERLLRFGMYAEATIRAELPQVVSVPGSAILYPGHAAYAYVDQGGGAYERRQVKLGREGNGSWEVLAGLEPGDRVVISGNVLLDAQVQFNHGGADRMEDAPALAAVPEPASEMVSTASASVAPKPAPAPVGAATARALKPGKPTEGRAERSPADPARAHGHVQLAARTEPVSSPMPMAPAVTPTPASPARANGGPRPAQALSGLMARADTRMPTVQAPGPALPTGNMLHIQIMDRWRERHLAEWNENTPTKTNALVKLTDVQSQSLRGFLKEVSGLAQALAADDLEKFNQQLATLSNQVARLQNEFTLGDVWKGHVQHFRGVTGWSPAKSLAEARAQFLPFTVNVVALVRELKKQEPAFTEVKVYHCAMAPKPGLWVQTQGPLANPYYGAAMLRCGEEVKIE